MTDLRASQTEALILQVGQRIRSLRHRRGWTLEQAAERAEMAVQNFSRLEKGRNLTLETIARLALVFDCEPWQLLAPRPTASPLDDLLAAGWRVTDAPNGIAAYDLAATAGRDLRATEVQALARLQPPARRHLRGEGWFLARAAGGSMLPLVPDGGWCVFRAPVSAPIVRKLVLLQHDGPDGLPGYWLKRVGAVEVAEDGSLRVRLDSLNRSVAPFHVRVAEERDLQAAGELVEVIGARG